MSNVGSQVGCVACLCCAELKCLTLAESGGHILHLFWTGNSIAVCNGLACACPAQLDIVTMLIGMVTRPQLFASVFGVLQCNL